MNPIQTSLILPPFLSTYDRSTIIDFLKQWKNYTSNVTRYNDSAQDDRKLQKSPLRENIDSSILFTVCIFELDLAEGAEDNVSDDALLAHFREKIGLELRNAVDVVDLFRPLTFTLHEDPSQSVLELFAQSRQILAEQGLTAHFSQHEELRKQQIKAMVDSLHPRILQDSVIKSLSMERIDCKSDMKKFYKFLMDTVQQFTRFHHKAFKERVVTTVSNTSDRAMVCFHCKGAHHVLSCTACSPERARKLLSDFRSQQWQQRQQAVPKLSSQLPKNTLAPSNRNINTTPAMHRKPVFQTPNQRPERTTPHVTFSPIRPAHPDVFRSQSPAARPPTPTTASRQVGPSSDGRISRCMSSEALDEIAFWKTPTFPSSSLQCSSQVELQQLPDPSDSTTRLCLTPVTRIIDSVSIVIDDTDFEFASIVDDGADFTVVGRNVFDKISISVPETRKVTQYFSFADGSTNQSSIKFMADIIIRTSAGPVTVRRHWIYVVDCDMPEVLLGRPLLLCLGIDIDRFLTELGAQHAEVTDEQQLSPFPVSTNSLYEPLYQEDDFNGFPSLGPSLDGELEDALAETLEDASRKEAPPSFLDDLTKLISEFSDVFRVRLGPDPPVTVEPVVIQLKPDAQPKLCRPRRLPPLHADFLTGHFQKLVDFNYVFLNSQSAWASPAFCVPKAGENRTLRSVVDLRYPNSQIVKLAWPMPHLSTLGTYLNESKFFCTLDAFKGFWQFPIAGEIDSQSIMTPIGIVTPLRLPQGNSNSVFVFQRGMEHIFRPTLSLHRLLIWIDDLLLHAPSIDELLVSLNTVFVLCRQFGLKLNACRCRFFLTEAKYCGRLYSSTGWRHDPSRLNALLNMPLPRTAADLMQFLCAATWISTHIPDFERHVRPLRDLLEELLQNQHSRSKNIARRIAISTSHWTDDRQSAFRSSLSAISNAATLAHPKQDLERCVFTDASMDSYSIIITQCALLELQKPLYEQKHDPLAFFSRSFRGASARWAIPEKEAYPIIDAIQRFDYLLIFGRKFRIFTDHKNLMFIFNPESTAFPMKQHTLDKLGIRKFVQINTLFAVRTFSKTPFFKTVCF